MKYAIAGLKCTKKTIEDIVNLMKLVKIMIRIVNITIYEETANGEKELKTYTEDRLFDPKDFAQVAAETNRKYSRMHPGAGIHLHMRDEYTEKSNLSIDNTNQVGQNDDPDPVSDCCGSSVLTHDMSTVCMQCGSYCDPVYENNN